MLNNIVGNWSSSLLAILSWNWRSLSPSFYSPNSILFMRVCFTLTFDEDISTHSRVSYNEHRETTERLDHQTTSVYIVSCSGSGRVFRYKPAVRV